MALTDTAIKSAKPTDKPVKMTDGDGLYLLIHPNGGKWWRFDYRFDSKRKTLSMGVYPDVSLRDARNRRDAARKQIANGIDPGEHRKAHKSARIDADRAPRLLADDDPRVLLKRRQNEFFDDHFF